MEKISSNNLIKIITHSHNHTNQLEGKHALLNVCSIVNGISKFGHILIHEHTSKHGSQVMTLMVENIPEYRFVNLKICLGVCPTLCTFLLLKSIQEIYILRIVYNFLRHKAKYFPTCI